MSQAAISDDFNDGEINYIAVYSHEGIDPQTPHKVAQANRCLTQPHPHPLPFYLTDVCTLIAFEAKVVSAIR